MLIRGLLARQEQPPNWTHPCHRVGPRGKGVPVNIR
jgi:hypothetical protein